ncbi:MAG: four helix bundle protein [Planctomycetes bacterium]|nr:four helix bundle protein [Planctomycetota bacterium]
MVQHEKAESVSVRSYNNLVAWQKARALVKRIYGATKLFPKEELYGLTQQIRRAAVSVPSNIAEGHGRKTIGEYLYHLTIARGSLYEVETQIILGGDLEYLTQTQVTSLLDDTTECAKVLQGLITSLKRKQSPNNA